MTPLRWGDPPPPDTRTKITRERDAAVEKLKTRPGEWAVVQERARFASGRQHWTSRGCETLVRKDPEGTFTIWARWPEPDPAERDPYIAHRRARGIPPEGKKL